MPEPEQDGEPSGDEIWNELFPDTSVGAMWSKFDRAREAFFAAQAEAMQAGQPYWFSPAPHDLLVEESAWSDNRSEEWLDLRFTDLPGLIVRVRVEVSSDHGSVCTGLHFERNGEAVTARDLRSIKLRPLMEGALAGYAEFLRVFNTPPVRPPTPGRRGHDIDVWRERYELYLRHRGERAFIRGIRMEFNDRDRPSDATVRRWVKTIEQKLEAGELP